ncbi:MAG: TIGR04053 family radical SAM/SPASM domain-containing protein [candidate division NC10 bacterium]|nr:TIGR04053 family radical SAM/SPASM domain-containing protein [candidate division NC10 bacterium]
MRYDPAQAPRLVAWETTRACDLACLHCRAVAQPIPDPRQLSTEEAFRLVDDVAAFQEPVILILTGGDPMKRGDIFDVAARASRAGLRVVMSPSGTHVTPRSVAQLKQAGVQRISVSLDGSTPELHDRFRQVPGAFAEARQSLAYAREGGLPFQINTTVTQHNRHNLQAMLRLAIELGAVTWDVFMLVPTGRGKIQMEITPEDYEETLHFVYGASQTAPIQVKMTCAPHYKRVQVQERRRQAREGASRPATGTGAGGGQPPHPAHGFSRGCMAGFGFCFVSHIGEVGGCGYLPLLAGNVRQASLVEVYRDSPLFKSIRDPDLLQGRCGICEYRVLCGGCRARALGSTGNYLEEEPFCTYQPAPRSPRELVSVEDLLSQVVAHESRTEAVPHPGLVPPAF